MTLTFILRRSRWLTKYTIFSRILNRGSLSLCGAITILLSNIAVLLIRLLVGGTLIVAGVLKLESGAYNLLKSVLAYDLIKGNSAQLVAKCLPWLEIGCGSFLLIGLFLPITSLVLLFLLLLFTLALTSAVLREKRVNCGCFGSTYGEQRVRWRLIYRNLGLMGLILVALGSGPGWWAVDNWLIEWPRNLTISNSLQDILTVTWLSTSLTTVGLHLSTRKRRHLNEMNDTAH